MKRTEIDWIKTMNGDVKIIDIRNVADFEELRDTLGDDVARDYWKSTPMYRPYSGASKHVVVHHASDEAPLTLEVGLVLSRSLFLKTIAAMKASRRRLRECKEYTAKNTVNTVTI